MSYSVSIVQVQPNPFVFKEVGESCKDCKKQISSIGEDVFSCLLDNIQQHTEVQRVCAFKVFVQKDYPRQIILQEVLCLHSTCAPH